MKRNLTLLGFCLLVALAAILYGSYQRSRGADAPAAGQDAGDLVKTRIPTRPANLPSPTPAATSFVVTTRAGQELYFNQLFLEPNEYVAYHTEAMPQGIPLKNGVEVALDYILRVDFGSPSPGWESNAAGANWPVSIILTDGSKLDGSLGFKAHHQIHLTGQSSMGSVDLQMADIDSLVVKRTLAAKAIPSTPPGEQALQVKTVGGETVQISTFKIFARCMYEVYCCHDETLSALPLEGKKDIDLNLIEKASFPQSGQVDITMNGQQNPLDYKLRPSEACPESEWRLRGKAALGDFEIPLSDVISITR
ncbi:MAG: hypothetical protein LWX83_05735 [Anaerolineae bacterium]|nr:hypothetical protein [Anaerolineae bacterium]